MTLELQIDQGMFKGVEIKTDVSTPLTFLEKQMYKKLLLTAASSCLLSSVAFADGLPATISGTIIEAAAFSCSIDTPTVAFEFGDNVVPGASSASTQNLQSIVINCTGGNGVGSETARLQFGLSGNASPVPPPTEGETASCDGGPGSRCSSLNIFVDRNMNPSDPPTEVNDGLVYGYFDSVSDVEGVSASCTGSNIQNVRCTISNDGNNTGSGTATINFTGRLLNSEQASFNPERPGPIEARPTDQPTFWVDLFQ